MKTKEEILQMLQEEEANSLHFQQKMSKAIRVFDFGVASDAYYRSLHRIELLKEILQ